MALFSFFPSVLADALASKHICPLMILFAF